MPKRPRTKGAYAAQVVARLTPGEDRIQDDFGDWICKLEYPDVGREAPAHAAISPHAGETPSPSSPEGSAVRYFTTYSPLCHCPDDDIRDQIARILAEIVAKAWRSGSLKVATASPKNRIVGRFVPDRSRSKSAMPKVTVLFLGFLTVFGESGAGQTPPRSQWAEYTNPALGVSVRYPPDTLEPVVTLHPGPGPNTRWSSGFLDLVARKVDPERAWLGRVKALRIAVNHIPPPSQPVPMSLYRSQKGYREMKVGGRPAANAILCGRAACHWGVHVASASVEVSILTLDPDETGKSGPDNARYPLRAIIDSIEFDPAFPK